MRVRDEFVKIIQKKSLVVSFGVCYNYLLSQVREWNNVNLPRL